MRLKFKIFTLLFVTALAAGCSRGVYDDMGDPQSPNAANNNNGDLTMYINTAKPLTALVTVKQAEDGSAYLYFNDDIKLRCPDRFERQYRAMCMVTIKGYPDNEGYCPCDIYYLEALDEGDLTYEAAVGGSDGLDILDEWVTAVDDGYLTLQYSAWFGEHPVKHDFHVVAGLDADNPYCLELRHDAHSDKHDNKAEGIISFDINTLPDTQGETVKLTLKYTTTDGATATKVFDFTTRQ